MSTTEAVALFLVGLVFFFLGLDGVKASLRGLASRSMRRRAQAAVASPLRAAILGITFGALSQSATAVAFLLSSLVSARLLPLSRALVVVSWANPGTAILAFLAAINLNLATLWIIGLTGLSLRHRKLKPIHTLLGALLGIGFLLFGLTQLKRAATPIQEAEWFATVSIALNASLILGFIAGALLRVVIQSSSAIVVILIALCGKGLLGVEQAMMVIHGTGVGIGLSVILLGQGLRGEALRISYWQAILNACSACVLAVWLLFAATDMMPSLPKLLSIASVSVETNLAIGFTLQMLLCPLFGRMMQSRTDAILTKLAPEAAEDELARPRFLDEGAQSESEIAIDLVLREQARVVGALPTLLDRARLDTAGRGTLAATDVKVALESLNNEIAGFLADLTAQEVDHAGGVQVAATIARQQALIELVEAVDGIATTVARLPDESTARMIGGGLVEATDVLLGTLQEWLERRDPADQEFLAAMTADRGAQMESVRRGSATLDYGFASDQANLLYATSLFERTVYLARRVSDVPATTESSLA